MRSLDKNYFKIDLFPHFQRFQLFMFSDQKFAIIKTKISSFLNNFFKASATNQKVEMYLFALTLPTLLNWGIYILNLVILVFNNAIFAHFNNNVDKKSMFEQGILQLKDIVLPFFITNFWTQLIWTLIFLVLAVIQIRKTKTTNFSPLIKFILIPFLYFITFVGSFWTLNILNPFPDRSSIIFWLTALVTILILYKIIGKNWATFCFLVVLWSVLVNLLGAFYIFSTFGR